MSSTDPSIDLLDDETSITEISFLPDGRVCLFGASRELISLLYDLNLRDRSLDIRHLQVHASCPTSSPSESTE